jgi:hypothetical protein
VGDIPNDFFAAEAEDSSSNELSQITMLADQMLHYQTCVAELESQLATANKQLGDIAERQLPEAMAALGGGVGMTEFVLGNGFKVAIKEDVFASIRKDMMNGAVDWFDAHGLGDIVKDEVKISLGKGESSLATKIMALAEQLGVPASEKLSVHAGTLKSIAKEQLARGVEFPDHIFSIYPFKRAEIKPHTAKGSRAKKTAPVIPAPVTAPVVTDFSEF